MRSRRDAILCAVVIGYGATGFVAWGVISALYMLTFPLRWPDGFEEKWGWIDPAIFAAAIVFGLGVGVLAGRIWYRWDRNGITDGHTRP